MEGHRRCDAVVAIPSPQKHGIPVLPQKKTGPSSRPSIRRTALRLLAHFLQCMYKWRKCTWVSVGACSHSSPVARDKRSQLAFVRQGPAWLRVHMAQVVIKAADNDSIPEPKPSVGEMGTSHEKRMSTSRSQGASAPTDSLRWKEGLPYAPCLRIEVFR